MLDVGEEDDLVLLLSSEAELPRLQDLVAGGGSVDRLMLYVGEEDVPHHRHQVHVEHAELGRNQAGETCENLAVFSLLFIALWLV